MNQQFLIHRDRVLGMQHHRAEHRKQQRDQDDTRKRPDRVDKGNTAPGPGPFHRVFIPGAARQFLSRHRPTSGQAPAFLSRHPDVPDVVISTAADRGQVQRHLQPRAATGKPLLQLGGLVHPLRVVPHPWNHQPDNGLAEIRPQHDHSDHHKPNQHTQDADRNLFDNVVIGHHSQQQADDQHQGRPAIGTELEPAPRPHVITRRRQARQAMDVSGQRLRDRRKRNRHQPHCRQHDQQWKPHRRPRQLPPALQRMLTGQREMTARRINLDRLEGPAVKETPHHGVGKNRAAS